MAVSTPDLSSSYTAAVLASTGNLTSSLRSEYNRQKKRIYDKEELLEKRKALQSEMRQIEMRENHPAWRKLHSGEVVDHSDIKAKKEARIIEANEQARQYKMDLEKMMMRVQNQPTLFERQSAVSNEIYFFISFFWHFLLISDEC